MTGGDPAGDGEGAGFEEGGVKEVTDGGY